jgi:hypothetical protein
VGEYVGIFVSGVLPGDVRIPIIIILLGLVFFGLSQLGGESMKKVLVLAVVLAVAGVSFADSTVNVPGGVTGLWRFQNASNLGAATVGSDIAFSAGGSVVPCYGVQYTGSYYTYIGPPANNNLYGDNKVFQESSWNYMNITHNISANGGGDYVNSYTILMDYSQGSLNGLWNGNYYNSLYNTSQTNSNDGDLFIKGPDYANSVIGNGDTDYSSLTFDSSLANRIVISVDNANFFRVYVNGTLFLDAAGQGVDGRFSLDPTVNLFADNDWEDAWGMVGTVAMWDHALTSAEVSAMGGVTKALVVPEPATMSLLALGGIALLRRNRK